MPATTDNRARVRDGLVVGYAEYGDPEGRPVMHLHGTPGSRLEGGYAGFDAAAERVGVRVIAPDRPGYGLSDWTPYTVGSYADLVAALADELGLERFAVMGYSGGGPFAVGCAARIRERLTGVVTLSGLAPLEIPEARDSLDKDDRRQCDMALKHPVLFRVILWQGARRMRKDPRVIRRAALNDAPDPDRELMSRDDVGPAFDRSILEAFAQGGRAMVYDTAVIARPWGFRLEEIGMPVHIWHGESDSLPPLHARILAEAIPDSRPRLFPGEGHFMFVRHIGEVLHLLAGS